MRNEANILSLANAAFRQAARQVIDRARRTGTSVVVWENGRVVELTPDEAESRLASSRHGAPPPPAGPRAGKPPA